MIHFPNNPAVKPCGYRGKSEVLSLTDVFAFDGGFVPKNFKTDGVSVWRPLWRWFHPKGKLFPAAVKHDYRYYLQRGSRKDADLDMLNDMKLLGVSKIKQQLVYRSLRAFGWRAWKRNRSKGMSHFWLNDKSILEELNN